MSGLLCAGDVYIDRLTDAGESTGLRKIGNATLLSLQETTERVQRKSKQRDTYGQALDSVEIKQPTQLAINLDEIDSDNLAIALLGDSATVTQSSGSFVDTLVTVKIGAWVSIGKRAISAVTVEEDTDTTPDTYILGTDYELDLRLGMIRALDGGALEDDQVVRVSGTAAAQTVAKVSGAVKPTIRAKIFVDGKNLANGDEIYVTIDETTLTPTSAVDFLSGEFVTLEMTGAPKTLPGKTSPYTVEIKSAA